VQAALVHTQKDQLPFQSCLHLLYATAAAAAAACRWLVAARRSPDALLQRLSSIWAGGLPGPAAAAVAAAAGLAAAGVLGEGQVGEVMEALKGLAGGSGRYADDIIMA
jgi:hypothetical protein